METPPILIVDDETLDAAEIGQVLKQAQVLNPIVHLPSGEQAVDYLLGTGDFSDRKQFPFPGLMLLDIKMPGLSGFDLLRWRSQQLQSSIKLLPIVVLTGVHDLDAIRMAYSLGACSFLTKPLKMEELTNLLGNFSGTVVKRKTNNLATESS